LSSLPPAIAALFAIYEVQNALQRALESDERLAKYSNPEKLLLVHLVEPLRMGEVAEALHCLPSNVTAIVDQLETKGLLRREACPEDRRAKRLVLTDRGKKARMKLVAATSEIFASVTGFGNKEIDVLLSLFVGHNGQSAE
jgi:MarR family transcriptional regulator, organic hydroperoxide resistance regulator